MKPLHMFSIVICCLVGVVQTQAQPYHLLSSSISSGGGKPASEDFFSDITLGQPIVGNPSSEEYQSGFGFWAQYNALTSYSSVQFAVAGGWNLVSVPLMVDDYTATLLFPNATSQAFAFQNGYVAQSVLANGPGYWLKFDAQQTVILPGDLQQLDSITVSPGWNLVGSISQPIATANVTSNPAGLIATNFFQFSSSAGYSPTNTIQPGNGYWVKVNQGGELIFSSNSGTPANRIRIVPTAELPPPPPGGEIPNPASQLPKEFALAQNYPNPFNPFTIIKYQLPIDSHVRMKIYNIVGQEITTIVDQNQTAGYKSVEWNASNVPTGTYFLRLQAGDFTSLKKMLVVK